MTDAGHQPIMTFRCEHKRPRLDGFDQFQGQIQSRGAGARQRRQYPGGVPVEPTFGGFKASGFGGRDNGIHAHDQYTQIKTIWVDLADEDDEAVA